MPVVCADSHSLHSMNAKIHILSGAAFALLLLQLATNADNGPCGTTPNTQVYDLRTDWSDSRNPNGAWSYHADIDGSLSGNAPFPWAMAGNSECPWIDIGRGTETGEFWRVKAE